VAFALTLRNHFFFASLTAAHLALAAALILALAAALIVNFLAGFTAALTTGFATGAGFTAAFGVALDLAALITAHLAFCAALIHAIPSALIVPLFFAGLTAALATGFAAVTFAYLALAAALIFAMADALILRLAGFVELVGAEIPVIDPSSLFSASICSLRFAACLSCVGVRFISIVRGLRGKWHSVARINGCRILKIRRKQNLIVRSEPWHK
jgi:hypothetical protein